jgi:hypothetical protein
VIHASARVDTAACRPIRLRRRGAGSGLPHVQSSAVGLEGAPARHATRSMNNLPRPHRLAGITLAFLCAAPAPARADSIVLVPLKDNTLFSNGNSNGAGDSIFSGRTGNFSNPPGIRQRAVLEFDVAGSVPAGSTIRTASLTLTLVSASPFAQPETHTLHRVSLEWGEGTSIAFGGFGAPPTTDDATWSHTFFPNQFWLTPGGDFEPSASASAVVGTTQLPFTWGPTPEMAADVQSWLDSPSSNHGWILLGDEQNFNTARRFQSRESGFPTGVPMLTIDFTPPPPCPDCGGDKDGAVGIVDLLEMLAQWGQKGSCDIDGEGVGITDLLDLLAAWGPCPP